MPLDSDRKSGDPSGVKPDPSLPPVRGKLLQNASLASALDPSVPVTVLGVGSNLIVRDGGIEGVVIRLMGKYWGEISPLDDLTVTARAGALDLSVAKTAASAGIRGLEFLSGIPGSVGGATRTNAGCYGSELKDVLLRLEGVTRSGSRAAFKREGLPGDLPEAHFSYRHTDLPDDLIVTRLVLQGTGADTPADILADIETLQARRAETQPIRDKTSGSTFANPDPPGTPDQRSAWKIIDAAGCRGLRVGGAQVSEKHCNFLINTGDATAADLEALGELVRARVFDHSGIHLRWEVRRIGRLQPPA